MHKKAEMGVGTLIIFIAMLLVAAVAAGVLIQTAGSLQEKSLATGQQARSQISTNARVIEVSGTDGRTGNLTDFQEIVKLSPGSDPIKLDQIIFTFNTKDATSTLKYKGTDGICDLNNQDGYNTWNMERIGLLNATGNYTLEEDLDDDGLDDLVYINNTQDAELVFTLSEAGMFQVL
jgi:archaeal flagellin FlaB